MSDVELQQATPIVVLGESRRGDLIARIAAKVEIWLTTWSAPASTPEFALDLFKVISDMTTAFEVDNSLICSIGGSEQLVVFASNELFTEVLGVPSSSGCPVGRGAISSDIYDEMLSSLVHGILQDLDLSRLRIDTLEKNKKMTAACSQWWAISVVLGDVKRECCRFLLSPLILSHLSPPPSKQVIASLSRRKTAIADAQIRVQAVLGEAVISVGDLAALAVNDVVVLQDELSHPSNLITADGRKVANISLGRAGSKRAVLIGQ